MSLRPRTPPVPKPIDAALRELSNAMQRLAMYPPGHGHAIAAVQTLHDRMGAALVDRDAVTIGVTPRGLLLDGIAIEPLPSALRELAQRLHRRNIGTLHIMTGVGADELATIVGALAAQDADERVGRDGLRLQHVRIEPLVYDVLEFADPMAEQELDEIFWVQLVEAAFGRRLAESDADASPEQIAEGITQRSQTPDGARRVYEALAGFSTALAARSERTALSARKRFVDVLSALSRPTTTRVMTAAPSPASRRRFLRETLVVVPPSLLLQLLESVAEADGDPISEHLRWLLGKLAGGAGGASQSTGAFAAQVAGLVEQWEGTVRNELDDDSGDPRMRIEGMRIVAVGLEVARHTPAVIDAARSSAAQGRLGDLLQLLDAPGNDPATVDAIASQVLDPGLLETLLGANPIDFALVARVVKQSGGSAVGPLLDALSTSTERVSRRRLLDLLVRVVPEAEDELLARLDNAPWYLARNIFAVLAQVPRVQNVGPILTGLRDSEPRVRHEALKAALRQAAIRNRAIQDAIEGDDPVMARMALASLERTCPPSLVAPVLSVLAHEDDDLRMMAIPLLADSPNPLVVPALLGLVRTRGRFLRRTRLAPKSPVMLAALSVLANRWSNHRPVVPVLHLAARSGDADVLAAMERAP